VISAWALLRSLEHGSYRWVTLAAVCVGFAFLAKYLEAYLVLPGFALVFGFSANTRCGADSGSGRGLRHRAGRQRLVGRDREPAAGAASRSSAAARPARSST